MEKLLSFIRSLTSFSDEAWLTLQPALKSLSFDKNEFLLREGEVCSSLFFIEEGFCRSYYDKDGVDKNTGFFFENEIVTNVSSFGEQKPSTYFIRACEPMTVVAFDRTRLMEVSAVVQEVAELGRHCVRKFASRQQEYADLFQLYAPSDRYRYLEEKHPQLLQRVSLLQLSSFLGIARETLSRIRSRRTL